MPNHSIKMIKRRQVFGLYGSGYGSRSISTTLGISHTTIRKYLRIFLMNLTRLYGFPQINF